MPIAPPALCRAAVLAGLAALVLGLTGFTSAQAAVDLGMTAVYVASTDGRDVVLGDLNLDGILDMATPNEFSNSVTVRLGTLGGGFGSGTNFVTGYRPIAIAIGDVTGDGRPDVVTANRGNGSVSVLSGDGAGSLGLNVDYALSTGNSLSTSAVAISDLNGDGRLDLAVARSDFAAVSVLLANPAGGFLPKTDYPIGLSTTASIVVADLTADDLPDMLVCTGISVLEYVGTGGGAFAPPVTLFPMSGAIQAVVADLNGNGSPDVAVISSYVNGIYIGFDMDTPFPSGGSLNALHPESIVAADFTGDGLTDLAVSSYVDASVSVWVRDAIGFQSRVDLPTVGPNLALATGDVNSDGSNDLVMRNGIGQVEVMLSTACLRFRPRLDVSIAGMNSYPLSTGDADSDHVPDLAVPNYGSNTVSVLIGNGDGTFWSTGPYPTEAGPIAAAIAHLDAYADPNLVVLNANSATVQVRPGIGGGFFGAAVSFPTGIAPNALAVGDLNGDGHPDLAITRASLSFGVSAVSILLGNGVGGFGPGTDVPTGFFPTGVAIGDVNGDFKPDLVVAGSGSSAVSVHLGNGLGAFGPKTDFATAAAPRALALGDLDRDGKLDVVTLHGLGGGAGTVSVMRGNGVGGFGARTDLVTGLDPSRVAIGDLTGEGFPDLAVANLSSNTVSIFVNNCLGDLLPKVDVPTPTGPIGIAMADLDLDGRLDLATSNNQAASASILIAAHRTRMTFSVAPNPVVLNSNFAVTATVYGYGPRTSAPSGGAVRYYDVIFPSGLRSSLTIPMIGGVAAGGATVAYQRGRRPVFAAYPGDQDFLGSLTGTIEQRVVLTAAPSAPVPLDSPNDQGGQLSVSFGASPYDYVGSGTPIVNYQAYRKLGPPPASSVAPDGAASSRFARTVSKDEPASVQVDGWELVNTVPAQSHASYVVTIPTLADSNASGAHRVVFFIRGTTANSAVYFDTAPDSGFSVDNLPPAQPAPFTAAFTGGSTHLHWGKNSEPDFSSYKLYRGTTTGFTPGPGNLIASPSDTNYVDAGPAGRYYKLSAQDVNGNQSAFAALTPDGTVEVSGGGSVTFALEGVRPNPARSSRLGVAFSLATTASARLELLDVSGRRIATREVGALGPGRHVVDMAEGSGVAPGIYFVRLIQGSNERQTRVAVIE